MSTVIITGSRYYTDTPTLHSCLDYEHDENPITLLVQGGAKGADHIAKQWAQLNNIKCIEVPADWDLHGKAAGPIRNREMLTDYPEARVIAFPFGESLGTRNCMKQAKGLGMRVVEYGV